MLPFLVLIFFLTLFCFRAIDLSTADLGRHISNGKWLFQDSSVLSTNFYSYTHPTYPFVNHHWGSGLIFYWLHETVGFVGLSIFYVLLMVGAFVITCRVSSRSWGRNPTFLAAIWTIPLYVNRCEIRPEGFSLIMVSLFFLILSRWREDARNKKFLYFIPFLMLLWVNLHVCFIFGFAILGAYLVDSILTLDFHGIGYEEPYRKFFFKIRIQPELDRAKTLALLIAACTLATLITPLGYKISLTPFVGFIEYGYRIVENQSIFFLSRLGFFVLVAPFFILLPALAVSRIYATFWLGELSPIHTWMIFAVFLVLDFLAVRNHPFLALAAIPFLASTLSVKNQETAKSKLYLRISLRRLYSVMIGAGVALNLIYFGILYYNNLRDVDMGLSENNYSAAKFFKENHLKGPIFNNYDIGSYLIYFLYPDEKPFIDNRPEAYPASFLTDIYVPMQENEEKWKEQALRYKFNTIFFAWHDYTPAGQTFLKTRINDPEWVPVYVDEFALILLKQTPENEPVIAKHRIPRDHFRFR